MREQKWSLVVLVGFAVVVCWMLGFFAHRKASMKFALGQRVEFVLGSSGQVMGRNAMKRVYQVRRVDGVKDWYREFELKDPNEG